MKQWYVIQVYAGYEEAVEKDISARIQVGKASGVYQVLVPSAKSKQMFALGEAEDERLFPGYVLIEMDNDSQQAVKAVLNTPRVLKFLGGKNPIPLVEREVKRILGQIKGEVVVPVGKKEEFIVGSEVDIKDGPFSGFVGIIDKIDEDAEKMTVMVSIFGRLTPVEIAFDQVKN